jgi:hypothetical protein
MAAPQVLTGFGCAMLETLNSPFGTGANAYDSILAMPYTQFSLNADTTTATVEQSTCSGTNQQSDFRQTEKWTLSLDMQAGMTSYASFAAMMGFVPKAATGAETFKHLRTLAVTGSTATATWVDANTTRVGVVGIPNAGPRRVVTGTTPQAGQVALNAATNLLTLHSSDALPGVSIIAPQVITNAANEYIGADASEIGSVAFYGIAFGGLDKSVKMPIFIPDMSILSLPSLGGLGQGAVTLTTEYTLNLPSGWTRPWKISNSEGWNL